MMSGQESSVALQEESPLISLVTHDTLALLEQMARDASKQSYSPYSHFIVGAAILCGSGKIFTGTNIENASYGLTNCGERSAIFAAASSGEREIRALAVYTSTNAASAPCGACRQVINEFGPHCLVLCVCNTESRILRPLDALLPHAFGPENLVNNY